MLIKNGDEILSTMERRYERELQEMGDRISLERRKLGLTQKQLADAIGVSEKYMTKIERGANISANAIVSIFRPLYMDPSYLFTGNPTLSKAPIIIRKLSVLTDEQYRAIMQTIDQFIVVNEKLSE